MYGLLNSAISDDLFECDFSYICAAADNISTDTWRIARSFRDSHASCVYFITIRMEDTDNVTRIYLLIILFLIKMFMHAADTSHKNKIDAEVWQPTILDFWATVCKTVRLRYRTGLSCLSR